MPAVAPSSGTCAASLALADLALGLASVFSSEDPPDGSAVNCFTPNEMRSFSTSMLNTTADNSSPFLKLRIASSPVCVHERSDK